MRYDTVANTALRLVAVLALASVFGCRTADVAAERVSVWPRAVNYEIFVRSFCDSSGDGIGDFRGMTSKLDYLADLGIEGLWLMPIHPSPSYHKYNVSDYYDVHPDYGTLEEFREFVREAHRRNIRVVIDMVINHSGSELSWFQDALADGPGSEYWDYYIWAHGDTLQAHVEAMTRDYPVYGRRNRWNRVEGTDYYFYSYFGRSMPQLNYDNPRVREAVKEIGRFWLQDVGVDGFRLDAARHVYPENRVEDIHQWWEEYRAAMENVKPAVYLLGEVWASTEEIGPYLRGIPALFNFDLSTAIQRAVVEESEGSLVRDQVEALRFYHGINPGFIDATFITNHDQNRIMSVVGGDENKARMAAALLLTLPGSPYLYYGEEIGMLGMKPDPNIREPFLVNVRDADACRANWREVEYNFDDTVVPLALQMRDGSSLYHHYRTLIHLRNGNRTLTFGDLEAVQHETEGVAAFLRRYRDEALLVVHNLTGRTVTFEPAADFTTHQRVVFENKGFVRSANRLELPPYSTVILAR